MDEVLREVLDEARNALARQVEDVMRKTESLRQLARMGVAATAGVLAGVGLMAQAELPIAQPATLLLALGFATIITSVVVAVAAATLFDASDLPVGPEPEALYRAALDGADLHDLDRSRVEGLLQLYPYNQSSLDRTARRARAALVTLVCGVLVAVAGFVFVVGGWIS